MPKARRKPQADALDPVVMTVISNRLDGVVPHGVYGVVLTGGIDDDTLQVDSDATRKRRAELARRPSAPGLKPAAE
jgi:hypothetical protein